MTTPNRPRMLRPAALLVAGGILVAVVLVLRFVATSSDYVFMPDAAHPVAPLVKVAGGHDREDGGGIYLVDVLVRKASLLEQLLGSPIFAKGSDLVPASDFVSPGETDAQEQQASAAQMRTSQQVAAVVALRSAGKKVTATQNGVEILAVLAGYPAAGKLVPSDLVVGVDGHEVRTTEAFRTALAGRPVGTTFALTVVRGGKRRTVSLTTVPAGKGSKRGIIGVDIGQSTSFHLPVRVSIDAGDIGGPSAGLAFALQVLEELGRNVDRGHKIAATGEILANGQVEPIGGIKQKTIGARAAGVDAFLVPAGQNAADARRYAHGLRIVPVKNFQQALRFLATLPLQG